MGLIREPVPVLPIVAVISRHSGGTEWTAEQLSGLGGAVALRSERFPFGETGFYRREMGDGLHKQFLAFERLMDQADLAAWKLLTNRLETQFRGAGSFPENRPLNLDPGYLTDAKLVLATTKDRDHRIYLHSGIYAEVTLHYEGHQWVAARWTYPDYRRPEYHQFFTCCREYYRSVKPQRQQGSGGDP